MLSFSRVAVFMCVFQAFEVFYRFGMVYTIAYMYNYAQVMNRNEFAFNCGHLLFINVQIDL